MRLASATIGGAAVPAGTSPSACPQNTRSTASRSAASGPESSTKHDVIASSTSVRPGHGRPRRSASRVACSRAAEVAAVPVRSYAPAACTCRATSTRSSAVTCSVGSSVVSQFHMRWWNPGDGIPAPYPRSASSRAKSYRMSQRGRVLAGRRPVPAGRFERPDLVALGGTGERLDQRERVEPAGHDDDRAVYPRPPLTDARSHARLAVQRALRGQHLRLVVQPGQRAPHQDVVARAPPVRAGRPSGAARPAAPTARRGRGSAPGGRSGRACASARGTAPPARSWSAAPAQAQWAAPWPPTGGR